MEECNVKVGDHVKRTSSLWSSDLCSRYPGNESLDTVYEVLETRYDYDYYAVRGKNLDTGIEYGLTDSNLIIVKSSSYEKSLELTEDKEDYSVFVRKNKIKLINPKTESYE